MPQPQLSIRSAKALKLAHKLAKRERRTVSQVVERALERYDRDPFSQLPEVGKGFWPAFAKLSRELGGEDIDLMEIINAHRQMPREIDL